MTIYAKKLKHINFYESFYDYFITHKYQAYFFDNNVIFFHPNTDPSFIKDMKKDFFIKSEFSEEPIKKTEYATKIVDYKDFHIKQYEADYFTTYCLAFKANVFLKLNNSDYMEDYHNFVADFYLKNPTSRKKIIQMIFNDNLDISNNTIDRKGVFPIQILNKLFSSFDNQEAEEFLIITPVLQGHIYNVLNLLNSDSIKNNKNISKDYPVKFILNNIEWFDYSDDNIEHLKNYITTVFPKSFNLIESISELDDIVSNDYIWKKRINIALKPLNNFEFIDNIDSTDNTIKNNIININYNKLFREIYVKQMTKEEYSVFGEVFKQYYLTQLGNEEQKSHFSDFFVTTTFKSDIDFADFKNKFTSFFHKLSVDFDKELTIQINDYVVNFFLMNNLQQTYELKDNLKAKVKI